MKQLSLFDEEEGTRQFYEKDPEFVKFKIGDRVAITNQDKFGLQYADFLSLAEGTMGTVVSFANNVGIMVKFDDFPDEYACWGESLIKVEE